MPSSLSPWLFPVVLGAGLWLAYKLYSGSRNSSPLRHRRVLIALTFLAWFMLAGLLVQPLWTSLSVTYHPPAIIIAVDESPSYAGGTMLRSASTVRKNAEEIRKSYLGKGFRVLNLVFGETVHPAESKEEVGIRTSLASLLRYLDSLAVPNLQGVFVFTDGRFNLDAGTGADEWPAPVFPVSVGGGIWGEIQGEDVVADLSDPDSGAVVSVEWRKLGSAGHAASLELRSGSKTFWKEMLPDMKSRPGARLRHRFRVPASAFRGAGENWTALVAPDRKVDNAVEKNDTLPVRISGLHRKRQVFLRPLPSLDERGLVDALSASDSIEVLAAAPESLEASLRGGVLWARRQYAARAMAAARITGAPLILYSLPGEPVNGSESFAADARVVWRDDVGRFLPGGVLNLSDLGASNWEFPRHDSTVESIAWVEKGGHRGLLLGRRKDASFPVFELSVPPLWSSRFRPDADERIRRLQERWLQGIAEWVRLENIRIPVSAPAVAASRPLDAELSRLGVDEEKLSALAMITGGAVLPGSEAQNAFAMLLPDLPRGQAQEARSRSRPIFPATASTLMVIGLLSALWALRKKLHLD